jgi:DNA-binding NarL/FixJ family response regulator
MSRTLLIVDDHPAFRTFARSLFGHDGFEVSGEAADGESVVGMVESLHPDVVLLDVQLPGIDGIEVARRLAALRDAPAVVLMSSRDPSDYGSRLTAAHIRGFIQKDDLSTDALATVLAGGR